MVTFDKLIIFDEDTEENSLKEDSKLSLLDSCEFGFSIEQKLESLIFHLLKKPQALEVHIQRIYFCYHNDLTEDLYAALIDFLIILEGRGHALGRRMVYGAKSKLPKKEFKYLSKALKFSGEEVKFLAGNMFSVFSLGFIGTHLLIIKDETDSLPQHDPLDIARDCIAYGQLDTAIETLENAILLDFNRQALHDDLLELYKVTNNLDRFEQMYKALSEQFKNMPVGWNELKGFFNDR